MGDENEAARLASSTPEAVAEAAQAAIATARAGIEAVKAGGLTGLDRLDAYDEATAALGNTANRVDLIAVTNPDQATRDAADAAKQELAKVRTDISLDRDLYDALAALDVSTEDAGTQHY